jgi:hypothetical protein
MSLLNAPHVVGVEGQSNENSAARFGDGGLKLLCCHDDHLNSERYEI